MKMFKLIAVLLCPILLVGCASITTGTHQKVPINSNPTGAVVTTNTGYKAETPCVAELRRNTDHTVTIAKEGYDTAIVVLRKGMCGSTAGNLILGGFIGLGVDAVTGAMFKLSPEQIDIVLHEVR